MADQSPFWSPSHWTGTDPGRTIQCWVAGLLRVGIGLSLLNAGLSGYFGEKNAFMQAAGMGSEYWSIAIGLIVTAIPYVGIALGVALIVGFLTTASSIGAAVYSLLTPIGLLISIVNRGGTPNNFNPGGWGMDPFTTMLLNVGGANLLPYAALIWLSPLDNHPISVDALIFGRQRETPTFPTIRSEVENAELEPGTKVLQANDHSSG